MHTGFLQNIGSANNVGLLKGNGKGCNEQNIASPGLVLDFTADGDVGVSGYLFIGGNPNADVVLYAPEKVEVRKLGTVNYPSPMTVGFVKTVSGRELYRLFIRDVDAVTAIRYQSGAGQRAKMQFPLGGNKMFLLRNLREINCIFQNQTVRGTARMPTSTEIDSVSNLEIFNLSHASVEGAPPISLFRSNMRSITMGDLSSAVKYSLPDLSECSSIEVLSLPNMENYLTGAVPESLQTLVHSSFDTLVLDWDFSSIPDLGMLQVRVFRAEPRNTISQYFDLPVSLNLRTYTFANSGLEGYNQSTLDQFIGYIYDNRNSYNNTVAKTCTFIGQISNAAPSGILQAPSGFIYGVSDGIPSSAMEMVWVLVNQTVDGSGSGGAKKYRWTFTLNYE